MADIQRGFVSIKEGQVHYRRTEARIIGSDLPLRLPLWMVHASPSSSVELVDLMAELGRSRRIIAPDTLGNGDSAAPARRKPDIAYYADASLRVMDALGIERVDLYGSHTGAHIVTEMAIARPDRVGRLVLDGIGMFSAEDKRDFLKNYAPEITPDAIGSQIHWAWHFVRDQGWFFPYFRRDAAHLRGLDAPDAERLHRTTVEVLKAIRTYHLAYRAAFAHADRERLPKVSVPSLVMADDSDPLAAGVPTAASLLPGAVSCIVADSTAADALERKAALIEYFLDHGKLPGDG